MRKRNKNFELYSGGTPSLRGTLAKIFILGLVDAGIGFVLMVLFGKEKYSFAIFLGLITLLVNWIYLRRGGLPAKYLAPGVILLIAFQVYVVIFSGYISFTNYGAIHNGSYTEALDAIQQAAVEPIEGAAEYEIKVVKADDGSVLFLGLDFNTGKTFLGGEDYAKHPWREITAADGLVVDGSGYPTSLTGVTFLTDDQIVEVDPGVTTMKIPLGPNLDTDGFIATADAFFAQQNRFSYIYDEEKRSMTRLSDNKIFPADESVGFFKSKDGEILSEVGWQVRIGWDNYKKIFGDKDLRGPLSGIILWTFLFAFLSVFTTFVLGLTLALIFNDERIRGLRIYRAIFILPYAFPAFLSAYVWRGMFNTEDGFINRSILGFMGPENRIPWLEQQGPARAAVLLVNLWLGFPYMFLICTGALQAIPNDLTEAAGIDGASPWKIVKLIKLPLLLVSLAPLLIASFAYNFNNFGAIYLVTGGGPFLNPTLKVNAGATDILITFVYRIAFGGAQGADYGLASAFSVLIFMIIGSISFFSFKRTRGLEELTQ
jgi:arabinogalactan oligomer/maltooligosaccharide transport system permease protein